ncbi:unnamed protein product [Orchesella dallaii]|uniref:Uncharacterized protein n=1 Tax=Orchesella dallaii TaxID=48710 RepID=A0ABP1PL36_9HEXA
MATNRRRGARAANAEVADNDEEVAGAGAIQHSPPPNYNQAQGIQNPQNPQNPILHENANEFGRILEAQQNIMTAMDRNHRLSMEQARLHGNALLAALNNLPNALAGRNRIPIPPPLPPHNGNAHRHNIANVANNANAGNNANAQANIPQPKGVKQWPRQMFPQVPMMPFPMFHPGMMNSWFQQPKPKPNRNRSAKALARIQKRTQKFKSGEVKTTRTKKETISVNESMDTESISPSVPMARTRTTSTQTNSVLIFDLPLIDPTKSVIEEEKKLSKIAFYKKYKAEIISKQEKFLAIEDKLIKAKNKAPFCSSTEIKPSCSTVACMTSVVEPYVPSFSSNEASQHFKKLAISYPEADPEDEILKSDGEADKE